MPASPMGKISMKEIDRAVGRIEGIFRADQSAVPR
jgi:hypothetical protein